MLRRLGLAAGALVALALLIVPALVQATAGGSWANPAAAAFAPTQAPAEAPADPAPTGPSSLPGPSQAATAAPTTSATASPARAAASEGRPRRTVDGRPIVYLTFDDGPSPEWTPQVLDLLDAHDASATFFMIGREAAANPGLVAQVRRRGNAVGNHTYDHPWLTRLPVARAAAEIDRASAVLGGTTCLRAPGGLVDGTVRALARERHLSLEGWTVDTSDWRRPGTAAITATALRGLRPGAVVLMHDGGGDRSQTLAALHAVLDRVSAAGMAALPLPSCR